MEVSSCSSLGLASQIAVISLNGQRITSDEFLEVVPRPLVHLVGVESSSRLLVSAV